MKFFQMKNVNKRDVVVLLIAVVGMLVAFFYTRFQILENDRTVDPFYRLFVILTVLAVFFMGGIFFVRRRYEIQLPKVFVVCSIIIGLMYTMIVPVYAVPDEQHAISTAYVVASSLASSIDSDLTEDDLDYDYGDDFALVRLSEVENDLIEKGVNRSYYDAYLPLLNDMDGSGVDVTVGYHLFPSVPRVVFVPSALGVMFGRFFNLGLIPTLLLGRIVNLLIYTLMGCLALHLLPALKEVLFLVMLLPMCMQQAASFSYDSMILGMSFLLFALVLNLVEDENEMAGKWYQSATVYKCVLMLCIGVFLSFCKYGALYPLSLLTILVFLAHRKKNRFTAFVGLFTPIIGLLVGFIPRILSVLGSGSDVLERSQPNYTIGDLLQDPLYLFYMIGNTIFQKLDYYIYTLLGQSLGNLEMDVPHVLILGFLMLIIVTLVLSNRETLRSNVWNSNIVVIGLICIFLAGCGIAVVGMGIAETPKTMDVIQAVQGRYFLPFLMPLLLLLVPKKKLFVTTGENKFPVFYLVEGTLALHFFMMCALFLRAL